MKSLITTMGGMPQNERSGAGQGSLLNPFSGGTQVQILDSQESTTICTPMKVIMPLQGADGVLYDAITNTWDFNSMQQNAEITPAVYKLLPGWQSYLAAGPEGMYANMNPLVTEDRRVAICMITQLYTWGEINVGITFRQIVDNLPLNYKLAMEVRVINFNAPSLPMYVNPNTDPSTLTVVHQQKQSVLVGPGFIGGTELFGDQINVRIVPPLDTLLTTYGSWQSMMGRNRCLVAVVWYLQSPGLPADNLRVEPYITGSLNVLLNQFNYSKRMRIW